MAALDSRWRGRFELKLCRQGLVPAGVDEVGRGCLAGPVHAGAVVLDYERLRRLDRKTRGLLRDSKQLQPAQRQRMLPVITDLALAHAVAKASAREIERFGIVPATFLAMRRALAACAGQTGFDVVLVDGNQPIAGYEEAQVPVVKGDQLCFAIAAASILAKEARDAYMREAAGTYPVFGFDSHVGYGTAAHLSMIDRHGICPEHRQNFAPVRNRIAAGAKGSPIEGRGR